MKRWKIWTLAVIMITATSATVFVAHKSDISSKQFLYEAGFKSVPEFANWEKSKERTYWEKKNLKFLTYEEADTLMKSNNFIISSPENFTGNIPDSIQTKIQKNYKRLTNDMLTYAFRIGEEQTWYMLSEKEVGWWISGKQKDNGWEYSLISNELYDRVNKNAALAAGLPNSTSWDMLRNYDNTKIMIIAHQTKFKPGTVTDKNGLAIPPPPVVNKDPLAVIRHRKGYVVLAHWE